MSLTIGSLFSGIGGLELGLEWAGLGPVLWQCEIDTFCRSVLAKHWPQATRFGDVTTLDVGALPSVDLLCGGFPCQDVSDAGKRAGIDGDRSGLWIEFVRVIRGIRPRFVIVENVSGLFDRGLCRVLGDIAACGYDAEWSTVRASDLGARHRRERIFIVAHATGIGGRRESVATAISQRVAALRASQGRAWEDPWPEVGDEVHGLPRGLANRQRIRALGNSVVPQCAQIVGAVIQQMLAEHAS